LSFCPDSQIEPNDPIEQNDLIEPIALTGTNTGTMATSTTSNQEEEETNILVERIASRAPLKNERILDFF
jgi:hypothetical protein